MVTRECMPAVFHRNDPDHLAFSVLRYAGDIYTELILRFAKSINNNATTLFKAKLSPYATGAGKKANGSSKDAVEEEHEELDTEPKKLEWKLTPELRTGIRFAETRLSDLICQNDIVTLEFDVSRILGSAEYHS